MVERGLLSIENHFTMLYTIPKWFCNDTTRKDAAGTSLKCLGNRRIDTVDYARPCNPEIFKHPWLLCTLFLADFSIPADTVCSLFPSHFSSFTTGCNG